MKRIVAFIFVAAIALAGFPVFAGGGNQKASASGATPEGPNDTLEITYITYNIPGYLPKDGNVIQKYFEEKYNIKIINVPIDTSNREQVNLFFATGGKFDVALHNGQGTKSMFEMADDGVIRSFPPDFMEQYAPHMVALLSKAFGPDWKTYSTYKGQFWSFPEYRPSDILGLGLRGDWLKNLGVTTLPKTLDELEALLIRFREEDPDRNGRRDTYGLGKFGNGNDLRFFAAYLFAGYGMLPEKWNTGPDGGPVYWATMPEYKQALARLRTWYQKEIFHPEVITDTRQTTTEKMVSNRIGGYFGTGWQFSISETGAPFGALQKAHPEMSVNDVRVLIPPVTGPNGKALSLDYASNLFQISSCYFGKDTSDAKVQRILRLFNECIADPMQYALNANGIEGQHFDIDAEGILVRRPEWTSNEKRTELGVLRYFINGFQFDGYRQYEYDRPSLDVYNVFQAFDTIHLYPLDAMSIRTDADYSATVTPIVEEYSMKILTGEWDINSTWDSYISRLNAAGLQKIIDAKRAQAREFGIIK
jgi:putative aldouronate transport system substrate-binding protein